MRTSYKATAILAVCALGAGLAAWWQRSGGGFAAGLLTHGFLAATIGGLADWFAVTAIFRRPLGIGWRTDILRRNRQRIMRELVDFAASDLLSRENIMATLARENLARMLVDYLTKRGGSERLGELAEAFLREIVQSVDMAEIVRTLAAPARELLAATDITPLVRQGVAALRAPENRERLLKTLAPAFRQGIDEPAVQDILLNHIIAMRQAYESVSVGRSALFHLLGLSDERLLAIANEKAATWLAELERGEGKAWEALNAWLDRVLEEGKTNPALLTWVEKWKKQQLSKVDLSAAAQTKWENIREAKLSEWLAAARQKLADYTAQLAENEDWQKALDDRLRRFLEKTLDRHHDQIPRLIETYLRRLSDDELVRMAEEKVADDLQMIRINGSVVGAATGIALYVLTYLFERAGS